MSTLVTNNVQIGQSLSATNNYTLSVPAIPDGALYLSLGNSNNALSNVARITNSSISVNGALSATVIGTANLNATYLNAISSTFTGPLSTNSAITSLQTAKAWVNFNGSTAAIRSSYNVSSITKNGTGDYTVNFATAMADANYNFAGSARRSGFPQCGIVGPKDGGQYDTAGVRLYVTDDGATSK